MIKTEISKFEGKKFDFKEKVDESFGKIICAYANTEGGKVIAGISKRREVKLPAASSGAS